MTEINHKAYVLHSMAWHGVAGKSWRNGGKSKWRKEAKIMAAWQRRQSMKKKKMYNGEKRQHEQ